MWTPLDIAVVGGGISGLASAYRLARLGHNITLIEGAEELGGLGRTFPYEGGHLEKFYHCILPDDDALIRLIQDIGMGDELLWRRTYMGFMVQGKVYPLNTPLDLLRFRPLPFIDRVRMGVMGLAARFNGLDPSLDRVAVSDWLTRRVGRRAFDVVWRPLLEAKIGDGYAAIPALWLSSRMNREKSTGLETKGCLVRGHQSLIDGLESVLRAQGVTILLGARVERIHQDGAGMAVRLTDGGTVEADTVVVTSPLVQFQQMTRELVLPPSIRDLSLDYQGVISGVFLLDRPLTPYYWMPIVNSGATSQGVIEMSNLVPLGRSKGKYVTYFVNYTHRDSPLYHASDEELLDRYRADLTRLFPDAEQGVAASYLFRAPFVEPLWPLGYADRKPSPSVIPGRLYLSSTAQLYPRVNSWNSCCAVVEDMVATFQREATVTPRRYMATAG